MAQDAMPAREFQRAMRALAERWNLKFENIAPDLARWFAMSSRRQTERSLKAILAKGGYSVSFRMTAAARDILAATVNANVGLIKSIPQEYLTQVEGMVMRSVQTGRDLGQLTRDLQRQYHVSRKRAAFIARDQNNKATSAIQKARQLELGLNEGIWMHSGGGKEPRPKHVRASGTRFKLTKGLKIGDKGQWVMPGEEINCRCVWRAVIPGFD
jgi:SPP1 gp7 family putative phage head morphogenesis protein